MRILKSGEAMDAEFYLRYIAQAEEEEADRTKANYLDNRTNFKLDPSKKSYRIGRIGGKIKMPRSVFNGSLVPGPGRSKAN